MNFYQRMGILPLKRHVNRNKCSFATKQRMFRVFAIDEILCYRGTRFPGSRTLCHPARYQIIKIESLTLCYCNSNNIAFLFFFWLFFTISLILDVKKTYGENFRNFSYSDKIAYLLSWFPGNFNLSFCKLEELLRVHCSLTFWKYNHENLFAPPGALIATLTYCWPGQQHPNYSDHTRPQ